jgi:hypothetical protein
MAGTKRKCPACGVMKLMRSDVKTCGCKGTNPFPTIVNPLRNQPKEKTAVEKPVVTAEDLVDVELEKVRAKQANKDAQIKVLTQRVLRLEKENTIFTALDDMTPQTIEVSPKAKAGVSESAAVMVWSDWHSEETVLPEQVSGKNEFNLKIFHERFWNLLRGNLAWFKINAAATNIKTVVLALLGDFITGSIHDDLMEGNQLQPADAIYNVFSYLATAVQYFLDNTAPDVEIIIPCHSGNHGRMTHEQRIATEAGNSLEYFMYLMLRDHFKDSKRVRFIVQNGYHSYISFFEGRFVARFHHGHQINYQGGVGGITVPVNKAIAQWNKARHADLDVFGHFHTKFDGGNFISNGALIGYSAYAVSIKGTYEEPSQQQFLINREYSAKTAVMPVFVKNPVF